MTTTTERYTIAHDGMGGFLDPPGSPRHTRSVSVRQGRREVASMALDAVLTDELAPEHIKDAVREIYAKADMQATEAWLSQVYGYFKHCYSPGTDEAGQPIREADRCLIVKANPSGEPRYVCGPFGEQPYGDELPPAETSLAVLCIREFFPDHEPREDLLTAGRWGHQEVTS